MPPKKNGKKVKSDKELWEDLQYNISLSVDKYLERCVSNQLQHFDENARKAISKMAVLKDKSDDADSREETQKCMQATFKLRRNDIVLNNLSVKNVIRIFPGLRSFGGLRTEFEMIQGKSADEFEGIFYCLLRQYGEQLEHANCEDNFCLQSLQHLRSDDDEDTLKTARLILLLCEQTNGKANGEMFVVRKGGHPVTSTREQPTVVVGGSPFDKKCADVQCENIILVPGLEYHESILAAFYAHFVFELKFKLSCDNKIFGRLEKLVSKMSRM